MQAVDLGLPVTNMTKPKNQLFCRLDSLSPSARGQLRLATLNKLGLLASEAVPIFEETTQKASTFSGAPISILGLVVKEELWFKSAVGLSTIDLTNQLATERKISLHESFSTYVIDSQQPLIIDNTYSNTVFANSILTQHYGIRTYLGVPLISSSGLCIGTLELMDWAERKFNDRDIDYLALLARWCLGEFERNQIIKAQPDTSVTIDRPKWEDRNSILQPASRATKLLRQQSHPDIVSSLESRSSDLSPYLDKSEHKESEISDLSWSQTHRPHSRINKTMGLPSTSPMSASGNKPAITNGVDEATEVSSPAAATNPIKIKLLSQLTQELRTPLTSVIGMASVLHREVYGPLTIKQREYLEIIHNSGQNLITLVDEIVSLGVLNEHSQINTAAVDIEMLCQQVVNSLVDIAQQHQQTLHLTIEPGNRIWSLDKDKVRQALYYLIISILEMSEAGGEVKIHVSKRSQALNIAVAISHPWLGEDFGEVKLRSQAVTQALNYNRSSCDSHNSFTAGDISLGNHQILTASALMMTIDREDTLDKNNNKIPRDILGLLFCCHLTELHEGRVLVRGFQGSSYRYLLQFPKAESEAEMNRT